MLSSLDLFSGSGALTLALHGVCEPRVYCELDPKARAVLNHNMHAGSLPRAPIHDDVRTLPRSPADMAVAGFPCTGFSPRGHRANFGNAHSALFYEVLRIADAAQIPCLFLENVPAIQHSMDILIKELSTYRGYELRWCTVSAGDLGAPHARKRWFCLCTRKDAAIKSKTLEVGGGHRAFDWRGTRAPPRTAAVADAAGKAAAYDRWRILGNAVVPDTARLAFFHLLTLGRVTELADGTATFVESTGALVAKGTKGLAVARDGAKVFVRAHGAMVPRPVTQRLVLDPDVVEVPKIKSVAQTAALVDRPVTMARWSTPRHQHVGPCRVLTTRSCRDLSTQIRFERDTQNRLELANPRFGEWMMGLPADFTRASTL